MERMLPYENKKEVSKSSEKSMVSKAYNMERPRSSLDKKPIAKKQSLEETRPKQSYENKPSVSLDKKREVKIGEKKEITSEKETSKSAEKTKPNLPKPDKRLNLFSETDVTRRGMEEKDIHYATTKEISKPKEMKNKETAGNSLEKKETQAIQNTEKSDKPSYKPLKDEVFFCAQDRRQQLPEKGIACTECKKTTVSWYTNRESSQDATKKWEHINGSVKKSGDRIE